jgi:hypothetical protein
MGIRNFKASSNAENTIIVPLFDHEGNPILSILSGKQAKIEVYGQDSKAFKKAQFENSEAIRKIYQGTEKDTPAKEANREIFTVKAIAVNWFDIEDDGVELEFTAENLESVLRDEPYLTQQINRAISDRANFVKKTDTPVLPTPKK